MPKTVDDEIDEAVKGLGVAFDGVDDGTLMFVPAAGATVENPQEVVDEIIKLLAAEKFEEVAGYDIRLVA